jgi:threonine dehydrogenase-like Zn-dependent dehydrogenase
MLDMLDLPKPEPKPGQVRIKTVACGICATDLQIVGGLWSRTGFPMILGHEWSGVIDAVGEGVDSTLVGRNCVAENVLADGGEVGFEHPGGYAEYFATEAVNVQLLPDGFPMSDAVLIEPLAVSVRGMMRLRADACGPFLVFGDGPIGLLMTMLCARAGHVVHLVGGRPDRLRLAEEIGAELALNYHTLDGDLAEGVRMAVGIEYPVVIEASGSGKAMDASLRLAGKRGRVLVIGEYGESRASFAWNTVLLSELEIIGSNASSGAWPDAVRLAVEEDVALHRLITHRLPATSFAEGYALMSDRSAGAVKVVLKW